MKVLFVIGSFREKSFNKTIAEYINNKISSKVESRFLNYHDIPFMNEDIEFPTPKEISKVVDEFKWADVIWIVTPEYNGSFPGGLKNLFDWVSRPLQGERGCPYFIVSKTVLITAAAYISNAERVITELKKLLERMKMSIFPTTAGIGLTRETVGSGALEMSQEQKAIIDIQVEDFLKSVIE